MKLGKTGAAVQVATGPYFKALQDYQLGKISELDLDAELVYGSKLCIQEYAFLPFPDPPRVFAEYEARYGKSPNSLQKRKVSEKVCTFPEVGQYFDEYEKVLCTNRAHCEWLEFCIITMFRLKDWNCADVFYKMYQTYPAEMKMLNGVAVWRRKIGNYWVEKSEEADANAERKKSDLAGRDGPRGVGAAAQGVPAAV